MLALFCACGRQSATQPRQSENAFRVKIENDCDAEVCAIHLEYYLNKEPMGGGVVEYMDHSPIAKGEVETWNFETAFFPKGADLSGFELELFILDQAGKEYPCGDALAIPAAYGETYYVRITGDYANGFIGTQEALSADAAG